MLKRLFAYSVLAIVMSGFWANAQQPVKVLNYDQLAPLIHRQDSVLYVINFWATWCPPCVKELPVFMNANEQWKKHSQFKMILVSLDNAHELKTKVRPFLKANHISTEVYVLDDNKRMNYWINEVYPDWSGTIPATVFVRNGKVIFFKEEQLSAEELQQAISSKM